MLGLGNGANIPISRFYDNPANTANPFAVTQLTGGAFGVANATLDVPNRISRTTNAHVGKAMTGAEGMLVKGWTVNGAATWRKAEPVHGRRRDNSTEELEAARRIRSARGIVGKTPQRHGNRPELFPDCCKEYIWERARQQFFRTNE